MLAAVRQAGGALNLAVGELQGDKKVELAVVRQYGETPELTSKALWAHPEIRAMAGHA